MTNFCNFFSNLFRFILPVFSLFLICFDTRAQIKAPVKLPEAGQVSEKKHLALTDQYIVVYRKTAAATARMSAMPGFKARQQQMREEANATLSKNNLSGKQILQVYDSALKGFAVGGLTNADVEKLRKDDQVDYIVPDQPVFLDVREVPQPLPVAGSCDNPSIAINGVPNFAIRTAQFGSIISVSGQAILVSDGTAPVTDACSSITNNISGKIAVIDRGICDFSAKAYNAQQAGAIGVIIINNTPGDAPSMGLGTNASLVTIPMMSMSLTDGNALKSALLSGPVTAGLNIIDPSSQCTPWGIARVGGGASGVGKRAWIIDSGVDITHPELNVNVGLSTFFAGTSISDEQGHGTHVAGTIAAKDNGIGVIGVAAGAEVVAVKVFSTGGSSSSIVIAGVNYVAAHAAAGDVVNMSLGGDPDQAEEDAVQALSAVCKVVISAGNDGKNANFASPARINGPNVYTISAMDINDNLASFSNFGNAPVDYSAPGVSVVSCWLNGGYAYLSGTSMAAPHVTGLLLLGQICGATKVIGDPDGSADRIATAYSAAVAVDNDHDGATVCAGDLDDNDASVYPGATEICDGKDNNCNGQIDEGGTCCPAGNTGTLFVNVNASGTNSGLSWTDAFNSLQSAISAANLCNQITQIWVAAGVYYPSVDALGDATPLDVRTKCFGLKNNLAIYGGFLGGETNLSQRNLSVNFTVLSGDIQQDNVFTNNTYNVILNVPPSGQNINNTAVVDGFVIQSGFANQLLNNEVVFPFGYGGGILNYMSSPIIRNCVFNACAAHNGGGIWNEKSSPALSNSSFLGNFVYNAGAGIGNSFSSPALTNCEFVSNNSNNLGGGMFNASNSSPTLTNCSFSGNYASAIANGGNLAIGGGSMFNLDGSSPIIKNSILWGNSNELVNINSSNPTVTFSIVQGGWSGAGSNNLNVNPRFVNQPTGGSYGDISLAACSPAINAGNPATNSGVIGTLDLAGKSRFYQTVVDIGGYEYQGAAATPPGLAGLWSVCAATTNWNTAANWASGTVPTISEDVLIPVTPVNQPVINATAVAKSVTLNTGASLSLLTSGTLTINDATGNAFANSGTVTNAGAITIGSTGATIGGYGIYNAGTFSNAASGNLTVNRTTDRQVYNATGSALTNSGQITIGDIVSANYAIYNDGTFTHQAGTISIVQASNSGIFNNGTFTNKSSISIKTVTSGGFGRGIYHNAGTFSNNTGGSITIDRCLVGILNSGTINNVASISIGTSIAVTTGISNALTFNNSGCPAKITTNARIVNTGTFANSGAIIENSNGNSSISSNSGLVQNLNGGTFTVGSGSPAVTTTGTIILPNTLTVSITPPTTTTSPGTSVTLTASGATSYTWNDNSTVNPLTVSPINNTTYTVTGVTGFCSGQGSAQINTNPLPVSLVSFLAKKQENGTVGINWVTANEVDNANFILERSKDLHEIETIAQVAADETPAQTHSYQYSDELPYRGTSYYRLKQVDLNGHITTYSWASIVIDRTYAVFPNPVIQNQFQLSLDEPGKAVIRFYNVAGRSVPLQAVSRGTDSIHFKVPRNQPAGIYLLQVEERGQRRQYRLVVE